MVVNGTIKVLSIEDDCDTQANLRDILELDGYCVESVSTLREAIEGRNLSEFSFILLDRKLPDGTADNILPRIKELAPHAAIIIMTGYTDLDGALTAIHHGATDYLLKPINPDVLRATLARITRLREAEQQARQAERLAAIGQMMTVLAHESGNALARSRASLELLELKVADRPEVLELIARVQKAQDDLQRLYEEVRGFAAPIQLEREAWNLRGVWRQAWENVMVRREGKDAQLQEAINGIDLKCAIDSFRLEQVFRNLFENALAACSEPVRVEVGCSEVSLHGNPAIRIAVRDNGPGLTPEQRRKLFEPFYTTKPKGTGLGMAIAKRVVEAHGGQIAVGEGIRLGAEFILILPRGTTSS